MPILDILQTLADGEQPTVDLGAVEQELAAAPTADPAPAEVQEPLLAVTMRNFISQLFSARDRAHQLHLRTRSFAKHVALGELYDGLIPLADKLAEVAQGAYGVMDPIMGDVASMTSEAASEDEAIKLFMDALVSSCVAGHSAAGHDSFLHSIIDEVQALVFRTKYKLDNLS
jgi:hypothetical protein